MKSWRVLLGQPVTVGSTLLYWECMLLQLWLLTRVNSCCGGFGCYGSLTEELLCADWSSCFKLAVSFLATISLFFSISMASHFVQTRLASSSASFAVFIVFLLFLQPLCKVFNFFSWFWKACASFSWSFSKLSYGFWSSLLLRSESVSWASVFRWRFGLNWQLTVSHSHWQWSPPQLLQIKVKWSW